MALAKALWNSSEKSAAEASKNVQVAERAVVVAERSLQIEKRPWLRIEAKHSGTKAQGRGSKIITPFSAIVTNQGKYPAFLDSLCAAGAAYTITD